MATVTIKADGTPSGTQVFDQNGADISNKITSVAFRHSAQGIPEAIIDLAFISLEAVGVPARMIGPNGKDVRRIEYADGTVDEYPDAA